MPVYKNGKCTFCGQNSQRLLIMFGYRKDIGKYMAAWACPDCRDAFDAMKQEEKPDVYRGIR